MKKSHFEIVHDNFRLCFSLLFHSYFIYHSFLLARESVFLYIVLTKSQFVWKQGGTK